MSSCQSFEECLPVANKQRVPPLDVINWYTNVGKTCDVKVLYKTKTSQGISPNVKYYTLISSKQCSIFYAFPHGNNPNNYCYFYIQLLKSTRVNGSLLGSHVTIGQKNSKFYIHNTDYYIEANNQVIKKRPVYWFEVSNLGLHNYDSTQSDGFARLEQLWKLITSFVILPDPFAGPRYGGMQTGTPPVHRGPYQTIEQTPCRFVIGKSSDLDVFASNALQTIPEDTNNTCIFWSHSNGNCFGILNAFDGVFDDIKLPPASIPFGLEGGGKILNPKTGRYVKADGRIGRKLMASIPSKRKTKLKLKAK